MPTKAPPLPRMLYHGSPFKTSALTPGFDQTGKLVKWDEIESNKWLYATTDADLATAMAVASMLSQHYVVNRFQISDMTNEIIVTLDKTSPPFNLTNFRLARIYLYTIRPFKTDGWEKVAATEHKGENTEWKTQKPIDHFQSILPIRVGDWKRSKKLVVVHPVHGTQSHGNLALEDDSKRSLLELRII